MSGARVLFIDRDGTLVEEPGDEQVDSLAKIRLLPGVIPALLELKRAGYRFVLVSNQDGLGTHTFPEPAFREPQDFIRTLFASQGIEFDAEFFCPHRPADGCECRKPKTGLLTDYLRDNPIDPGASCVIGDRETDLQLAANLGIHGLKVHADGRDGCTWQAIVEKLRRPARVATVLRKTKETDIRVRGRPGPDTDPVAKTGIGFFDHMLEQVGKHGGFALEVSCEGDLTSTSTTRSRTSPSRSGRAHARRSATSAASGATVSPCPWTRPRRARRSTSPGGPYFVFEGTFGASPWAACRPNWCRTSSGRCATAAGGPARQGHG